MISQKQQSQDFKIMQLDLDDSEQEETSPRNKVSQDQPMFDEKPETKNQKIEINSLQSFKSSLSPQKKPHIIKQRIPNLKEMRIDDISELKSQNRSEIEFFENSIERNPINYTELQEQWRQDSPQKMVSHLEDRVNRGGAKTSLMCPQPKIYHQSYRLLDNIYSRLHQPSTTLNPLHSFLHTPLLSLPNSTFMRYTFQIHLYKFQFTFHTYFEFYLRNSAGQMINILRSEKDGLTVSSAHLLYAIDPKDGNKKEFTAKLKYNTMKTEYNLYDVDEKESKNVKRRLLATVFYEKRFGQQRELVMYVPKLEYRSVQFIKSEQCKNLTAFYDESQSPLTRKIQKLKTLLIPKSSEEKVRQQFSLKKQGRKILMTNEQDLEKFYMGKRQQERYIILAAGGMTPLEVFMLAVVNLEH